MGMLLFCSQLSGQGTLQWSAEHKIDGQKRIVAAKDGAIYIQRSLRGYFQDTDYRSDLSRYDSEGNLTHVIAVEQLEERNYQEVAAIDTDMGIAIIYLTTDYQDPQYLLIAAQLYSHQDLSPLNVLDLKKVKYTQGNKSSINDYRNVNGLADIDVKYSEDRTKVAIAYIEEQVGQDKYTKIDFSVYDLQNGIAEVNSGVIRTDYRSDKYLVEDISISNVGDLAYLIKEYTESRDIEFVNKKPGYRHSLYYFPRGRESFIYDIPMKQYFIDGMQVALDDEANMYVAGMVREKPADDVLGTIVSKVDTVGTEAYTKIDMYSSREIEKIRKKKKSNLQREYEVLDLRLEDMHLYMINEYYDLRLEMYSDPTLIGGGFNRALNQVEYGYKEDLLIHRLDMSTGERVWTTTLPKRQSDYDAYEQYTTGNLWLSDGNLYVVRNERQNNLKRVKEGKSPRNLDLPGRTAALLVQTIDTEGKVSTAIAKAEDRYLIMHEGSLVANKKLHLLTSHRNDRKFRIATLNLR